MKLWKCRKDCASCRKDCGDRRETGPERSYNRMTETVPEHLRIMRDELAARYTPSTLMKAVLASYGSDITDKYGIVEATAVFLKELRYDLGLKISDCDIYRIAEAIVEKGDVVR